jgi:hypothetical protein
MTQFLVVDTATIHHEWGFGGGAAFRGGVWAAAPAQPIHSGCWVVPSKPEPVLKGS